MRKETMKIQVNGEVKTVESGLNLYQLLLALEIDPRQPGIAVALNWEVIPRKQWQAVEVQPDSEIEIVRAVQGG
jgi:thiamine biosynthesis protein ThiS